MNLQITNIQDEKDLKKLKYFMLKQPQYYPNFRNWVEEKCLPRIESEKYKTIIVISEGKIIGDAIYRKLDKLNTEIKNFRIDKNFRNRDLGHFLLNQIFFENPSTNLITDVTTDNFPAVEFFIRNGFNIVEKKQLYKKGQDELILVRNSFQKF